MKTKTTVRVRLTPARMSVTKEMGQQRWGGRMERKGEPQSASVRMQSGAVTGQVSVEVSTKPQKAFQRPRPCLQDSISHREPCTSMFTAALFTRARRWKQPSSDEWAEKVWSYTPQNSMQPQRKLKL